METGPVEHRHIITWSDPEVSAQAIKTMSGLDYLRVLKDGRSPMPPMYRLFNFRFLDVEGATLSWSSPPLSTSATRSA